MIQPIRERWRKLLQRERTVVLLGVAVMGLALLFVTLVDPLFSKLTHLERETVRKQREITELVRLGRQYATMVDRRIEAERRMPGRDSHFSLLTFIEEAAITAGVREWITGMQPEVQDFTQGYQETAVDLRLEGVQLPEVLDLLLAIEQAPYDLRVHHLQIRPKFDNPMYLDVNLRVLSYAKSG